MSDDLEKRVKELEWKVRDLRWSVIAALLVYAFWVLMLDCKKADAASAYAVGASYANRPAWAALVGFDEVLLSPRAEAAADSLRARGVRVRTWVQPVASLAGGVPWRNSNYDRDLWNLLDATGGVARYPSGDTVMVYQSDDPLVTGLVLLDLGRPEVAQAWAALLNRYGDRWLLDYGCGDLSWLVSELSHSFWARWEAGFDSVKVALPDDYCQCDWWQGACRGVVMEKIGQTLNPLGKTWNVAMNYPAILLLSRLDAQARRATAAIALLTDAGMNWGWATSEPNRAIPELDGRAGVSYDYAPPYERAPGVWMRRLSHSFAIVNLSPAPFVFSKWTVGPGDGLVVLIRDAESGRYMSWRVP